VVEETHTLREEVEEDLSGREEDHNLRTLALTVERLDIGMDLNINSPIF
jgi:hypothetical protein